MANSSSFLPCILARNLPSLNLSGLESVLSLGTAEELPAGGVGSRWGLVLNWRRCKLSLATSLVQLLFHPIHGRPYCFACHKAPWLP